LPSNGLRTAEEQRIERIPVDTRFEGLIYSLDADASRPIGGGGHEREVGLAVERVIFESTSAVVTMVRPMGFGACWAVWSVKGRRMVLQLTLDPVGYLADHGQERARIDPIPPIRR
jgi:hypothetical protein